MENPAFSQASAISVPDDKTGTVVVLYVIVGDDGESGELHATVDEDLGKPFRPREIHFMNTFPKTQSWRIIPRAVAAIYTGEEFGDLSSIENPDAFEEIAIGGQRRSYRRSALRTRARIRSAWRINGESIISPSISNTPASVSPETATTRSAHSTSSSLGANASLITGI